jgi:hypothetical protein
VQELEMFLNYHEYVKVHDDHNVNVDLVRRMMLLEIFHYLLLVLVFVVVLHILMIQLLINVVLIEDLEDSI